MRLRKLSLKKLISFLLVFSLLESSCGWARESHVSLEEDLSYHHRVTNHKTTFRAGEKDNAHSKGNMILNGSDVITEIIELVEGGTLGSIAEGVAAAGFGSLVSQASVSLANRKGNIGKVVQDLTSSQHLKALGISMGTAGLAQGILGEIEDTLKSVGFTDKISRSVVQTGVSTGFNVVTQDLGSREALFQMLANVGACIIGEMAAEKIGDLRVKGKINGLTQTGAHVGLGALVGAASNLEDPLRGAAGGAMGAGIAETIAENLPSSLSPERRLDIAVLGGGIGAFIVGGDVNAAGVAGTNAVENNCILHPSPNPEIERAKLKALQTAGDASTREIPMLAESQQAHLAQVERELEELRIIYENPYLSMSERRLYSERRGDLEERRDGLLSVPTTPLGVIGLCLGVTPLGRGVSPASRVVKEGASATKEVLKLGSNLKKGAGIVGEAGTKTTQKAAMNLNQGVRKVSSDIGKANAVVSKSPQTTQAPSANSWIVNTAQYPSNNYKLRYSLASKQQMREPGTIIAGRGAKKTFDDAPRIVSQYGGRLEDWVKKSSSIYRPTDGSPFQTHWVENLKTAKKVEFKIKIIEE